MNIPKNSHSSVDWRNMYFGLLSYTFRSSKGITWGKQISHRSSPPWTTNKLGFTCSSKQVGH